MLRLPFQSPSDLPASLSAARAVLAEHGIIALPTESSYGLAVDPRDRVAVKRVFELKGREKGKDLLVIAGSLAQIDGLVHWPAFWRSRLEAVWPAPLTVILPTREELAASSGAALAVRLPAHALVRGLLLRVGPLTATSANRSGTAPLTTAQAVAEELGEDLALLLDGGPVPGGAPSTLLDLRGARPRLLRPGPWQIPADWM
ncbi:MAG: threonylcarbamoyl-AMP synthase [Acidobacteria bacterium]|nr:threonylcarbamoyl-AMP synthase [Acidobacteriota bacterium]